MSKKKTSFISLELNQNLSLTNKSSLIPHPKSNNISSQTMKPKKKMENLNDPANINFNNVFNLLDLLKNIGINNSTIDETNSIEVDSFDKIQNQITKTKIEINNIKNNIEKINHKIIEMKNLLNDLQIKKNQNAKEIQILISNKETLEEMYNMEIIMLINGSANNNSKINLSIEEVKNINIENFNRELMILLNIIYKDELNNKDELLQTIPLFINEIFKNIKNDFEFYITEISKFFIETISNKYNIDNISSLIYYLIKLNYISEKINKLQIYHENNFKNNIQYINNELIDLTGNLLLSENKKHELTKLSIELENKLKLFPKEKNDKDNNNGANNSNINKYNLIKNNSYNSYNSCNSYNCINENENENRNTQTQKINKIYDNYINNGLTLNNNKFQKFLSEKRTKEKIIRTCNYNFNINFKNNSIFNNNSNKKKNNKNQNNRIRSLFINNSYSNSNILSNNEKGKNFSFFMNNNNNNFIHKNSRNIIIQSERSKKISKNINNSYLSIYKNNKKKNNNAQNKKCLERTDTTSSNDLFQGDKNIITDNNKNNENEGSLKSYQSKRKKSFLINTNSTSRIKNNNRINLSEYNNFSIFQKSKKDKNYASLKLELDNKYQLLKQNTMDTFAYFKLITYNDNEIFDPMQDFSINLKYMGYNECNISLDSISGNLKIVPKLKNDMNYLNKIKNNKFINIINNNIENSNVDIFSTYNSSTNNNNYYINIKIKDINKINIPKNTKTIIKIQQIILKFNKTKKMKFDINKILNLKEMSEINMKQDDKIRAALCNYFSFNIFIGNTRSFCSKIDLVFINYEQFNSWIKNLNMIINNNNNKVNNGGSFEEQESTLSNRIRTKCNTLNYMKKNKSKKNNLVNNNSNISDRRSHRHSFRKITSFINLKNSKK